MLGCFSGVIILALAKGNIIGGTLEEKPSSVQTSSYLFGVSMVFTTSLAFSTITVITRKIKAVNFSLMMFYYGLFASIVLLCWLITEFILFSGNDKYSFQECESGKLRILCYDTT